MGTGQFAVPDINPASKHVATLLESDEVYVVIATIKSNKFVVGAKADGGASAEVKVPDIQQIVGAKIKVSAAAGQKGKVTYEGPEPLIFGFQAIQLFYDAGATRRSRHSTRASTPQGR